jgi:hypothetical protein
MPKSDSKTGNEISQGRGLGAELFGAGGQFFGARCGSFCGASDGADGGLDFLSAFGLSFGGGGDAGDTGGSLFYGLDDGFE